MGPFRCDFRWQDNEVPISSFHLLAVTFALKRQQSILARVSRAVLDASQSIKSYLKVQCVLVEVSSNLNPEKLCR